MQCKTTVYVLWLLVFLLTAGFSGSTNATGESGVGSLGQAEQGIKVHGRWIIEIRNPDGSLVSRREFDNALQSTGSTMLSGFLSRTTSPGGWMVWLTTANTNASPPCGTDAFPQNCVMVEPTYAGSSTSNYYKNLTVGRGGTSQNTVVLNGSAIAQRNGSVQQVATAAQNCTGVGSTCLGGAAVLATTFSRFTFAAAGQPDISVQAGQQIQVTVEFSFS